MIPETENILEVDKLITSFETDRGLLRAVDQVSFTVPSGKTVGIVGESGSGKSVAMMALMGLVPFPGHVRAERLRQMLVGLGIPAERIQIAGRGKRELLVPTDDNVPEPRNRRVEISVR